MLVPNLLQPGRIAAAHLLAQGKAGDVPASGLQLLTGFDDGLGGKFGWAPGLLSLVPYSRYRIRLRIVPARVILVFL